MAKRSKHSNVTDSGSSEYPPVHSKGQGFVSPLLSPVEKPMIGYEVDADHIFEDAPNPGEFPIPKGGK